MATTTRIQPKSSKSLHAPTIAVMSTLLNRIALGNTVGTQSYNGDRDIYTALGYKDTLSFDDYLGRYFRQDMAKAIIDRPVNASWKGEITVIENTKTKKTKFEKQWHEIYTKLKLKSVFVRADKLTGLGRYSVLLLGLNDISTSKGFQNKVKKGSKLIYVKPFSENSAVIDQWETDQKNPRYGLPLTYKIKLNNEALKSKSSTQNTKVASSVDNNLLVHYSRIIHITEDILEDEIYGLPSLEVVFNRLMDLEKLVGGDAEMFWRGARPGYTGNVKPDYEMTPDMLADLQDQIKEFEHNLKRVLVNEGVDYKSLEQQIADPSAHVDVQVQMISAVKGIPKRILIGSERGELSSAQDKQEWDSYVASRREEKNEPCILRPFIDHMIEYKIIETPKNNDYTIVWDKLFSLSDKEKVELGKNRAIALKEYSTNPAAQYMFPYTMFLKYLMGMDDNQLSTVLENRKEEIASGNLKELSIEEIAELGQKSRQMERTTSKDTRTESGSNKKTAKGKVMKKDEA
jgi:hypothetical protein